MVYEEFEPAPELADIVNTYWAFTIPADAAMPFDHRVIPDGLVSFAFIRSPYFEKFAFVGPRLEALNPPVHPGGCYWGIRFQPGVFHALFGISPAVLRDLVEDAQTIAPGFVGALAEPLRHCQTAEEAAGVFDQTVAALTWTPPDRRMLDAIQRLMDSAGQLAIGVAAAGTGLSERQFRRRFVEMVGLTPKEFALIRRLRGSVIRSVENQAGWADIAAEAGYTDQAHLTHDYTRIMGIPPTTLAERLRRITHGAIHS